MPLEDQQTGKTRCQTAQNGDEGAMSNVDATGFTNPGVCQHDDDTDLVLERLLAAHEAFFDVTRDYEYAGRRFGGYAEFHSVGEKYILVKKAKLWEVAAHEYLFFATTPVLDEACFEDLLEFMKEKATLKVEPKPNHMTSYVSLVIIAKQADPAVVRRLKKTKYHKTYKLGLQGWAELRLCVIDLAEKQVMTNAMGKTMKPLLESNAGFATTGKKKFLRR